MAVNHALLFINNGPRQGMEPRALENYEAIKAFWNHKKQAGKIDNFMFLTPQSTGNKSMPAAMLLVTGDRATVTAVRHTVQELEGGRRQEASPTMTFNLRRVGGGWVIDTIQ